MARQVSETHIASATARLKLKPAAKPYYRAIDEGLHLGYRRNKTGGKWVMRLYTEAGTYKTENLGSADDTLPADGASVLTYAQASAMARVRFVDAQRVASGMPAGGGRYTVAICIAEYIEFLKQHRKSGEDARMRADAAIIPTLGDIECAKLTTKRLREWRDAIAASPARTRTKPGKPQKYVTLALDADAQEIIRKRRATTNRLLTILKAALNMAWRDQKISSDQAWRALSPFGQADAARVRYLTVEECKLLIAAAAEPSFRRLVQAALLTGCRYGEITAFDVGDYNPDSGTLQVRRSKGGKSRHVVLTEEGQSFFASLSVAYGSDGTPTRRASGDVLVAREDGTRWDKSQQSRPMAVASTNAKLDPPATFHTLRHTYASLSIMNAAPIMVVARNLGHADTRMVEKHYGHLSTSFVADAIRAAAPRFGITSEAP